MRISDWSSDVCSSDLDQAGARADGHRRGSGGAGLRAHPAAGHRDAATPRPPGRAHRIPAPRVGSARAPRRGAHCRPPARARRSRSEEHTSELQSLMRISYAVFRLTKKNHKKSLANIKTEESNTST